MSFDRKLLLLLTATVVACLAIGGLALLGQLSSQAAGDRLIADTAAVRTQMRADMAHDAIRGDVNSAIVIALSGNAKQTAAALAQLAEHGKNLREAIDKLRSDAQLEAAALEAVSRIQAPVQAYLQTADELGRLAATEPAAAAAGVGRLNEAFKALEVQLDALGDAVEASESASQQAQLRTFRNMRIAIGGTLLLGVLTLAALTRWLRRSTLPRLDSLLAACEAVAAGNLEAEVDGHAQADEIGRLAAAFDRMVRSLRGVVGEVRHGIETVDAASADILQGNQDLSSRTERQAANLQQTASSMDQLMSMVRENGEKAQQANRLAESASEVATRGGEVVGQVVTTMGAISASSERIEEIITVIDGIAFQTNILALNAAVEAARAGEHGRGFAVVASEVRQLAQRSAQSAREIKGLISDSVAQVTEGSNLVDAAGKTIHELVDHVRNVSELIGAIASATLIQGEGLGQVGDAVGQLDQMTQQNAALAEQGAAAADSLKQQAARLKSAVAAFGDDAAGRVASFAAGAPTLA